MRARLLNSLGRTSFLLFAPLDEPRQQQKEIFPAFDFTMSA